VQDGLRQIGNVLRRLHGKVATALQTHKEVVAITNSSSRPCYLRLRGKTTRGNSGHELWLSEECKPSNDALRGRNQEGLGWVFDPLIRAFAGR
jgi:hypothetical protein